MAAGLVVSPVILAQQTAVVPEATAKQEAVTVMEDTPIAVRTSTGLDSNQLREGTPLTFTVIEDVRVGQVVAIPRGAVVRGIVVHARRTGTLTGAAELTLRLTELDLGGRVYPISSYQFRMVGTSKTRPTERKVLAGATVGAVVGSVVSGGTYSNGQVTPATHAIAASVGAAAGAGVGTMVAAASPGPELRIPAEAQIEFALAAPATFIPPSPALIQKLGEGLKPGGPVLYVRGERP
jgi:hypothetical protein